MSYKPPTTIKSNAATDTDFTSVPFSSKDLKVMRFQMAGPSTSSPTGTISVEASDDPRVEEDIARGTTTALWVPMVLPAEALHGSGWTLEADGTVTWTAASALVLMIILADLPRYLRLKWNNTSGGGSTGLYAFQCAGD